MFFRIDFSEWASAWAHSARCGEERGLTGLSILYALAVLLAASPANAAVMVGPKRLPAKVLGVGVVIGVTAGVELSTESDAVHARIDAKGDLTDIQAKALEIAKAIDLPKDNCAHDDVNVVVDDIDQASLSPSGDAAVIALSGHVTVWECRKVLGAQVKAKLLSDSVTLSAPVRLVAIGPMDVAARLAGDPTLATGGKLSAIAASVLAGDLRGKLAAEIAKAFEANALKAQLPDLPGLVARIERVGFAQDGGHLSVHAVASTMATGETLGAVVDRLLPSAR